MTHITSEDDFLALVDRHFPRDGQGILVGRGDDAAVVAWPERACVTTDLFIEDVHFRRSYFSPRDVGYKALAVNVSDVAAMGGVPEGFVLGCICPDGTGAAFWDGVLAGLAEAAAPFDLPLLGGDLDKGPMVGIAVTVWGRPGLSGRLLTRGTARPGDVLFAVGTLGLARAGLTALEQFGPTAGKRFPEAVAAHLRPTPQVAAGLTLAGLAGVTACMDVSDGLARDLPRLLPPEAAAALALDRKIIHPEITALAKELGRDPLRELVRGGEDYALLGAAASDAWPAVAAALPGALALGRVTEETCTTVNGEPLADRGFDHFG